MDMTANSTLPFGCAVSCAMRSTIFCRTCPAIDSLCGEKVTSMRGAAADGKENVEVASSVFTNLLSLTLPSQLCWNTSA